MTVVCDHGVPWEECRLCLPCPECGNILIVTVGPIWVTHRCVRCDGLWTVKR